MFVDGRAFRVTPSLFLSLASLSVLIQLTTAQQGSIGVLLLSGEGPAETQLPLLQATRVFETQAAVPLRVFYRVTSTPSAAASVITDSYTGSNGTSILQFAVTERPLTSAERASFTSNPLLGDSVHLPLFINSYGLFYNVPGNGAKPLNITACLAARILKGDISDWTHPDLLDRNPGFVKASADSFKINVLIDTATSGSTIGVFNWLSTACPSIPITYDRIRTDAVLVGSNMVAKLESTPFSLGWAMGATGREAGIPEFAVETATAGVYLTSGGSNTTDLFAKLATIVPTSLTGDYSSVSASNLAGGRISPILTVSYLITKANWSATAEEGQKGEAIKALCRFLLSPAMQGSAGFGGVFEEYGLISIGDATLTALRANIDGVFTTHILAVPYVFTDGNGGNVLSSTRTSFDVAMYSEVLAQLTELRRTIDTGSARVMRGAGSSAVSLFMWRCFSELRARSTSPMYLVYRAAGSGAGQSETIAKAKGYQALVDFGVSDTPMPDPLYSDLTANAKISMMHIPIMLAPMNFFVNIPEGVLPSRKLQMSPCTLAGIMQGDITRWSHENVAHDNNIMLPDQPITVFYRMLSSGTTAVITAYLTGACRSWRLGSGSLLSTWPTTFKPTANSANMSTSIATTPWSIGYLDAANGLDLNLLEVAVKNSAGNFVTTQTGDITGAASALFKSDAWPKTPTQSFSAVSVLNQPGDNTFPIVAMPFMFVRTDLTSRGDSGALLQAFLSFMLDSYAQSAIAPALGFAPLPVEVRQYALSRALPLLQVDTRAKSWTFESGATLAAGQGGSDYVISSFASNYESTNAQSFADFYKAYSALQNKQNRISNSTNSTSAVSTIAAADIPANLRSQLDSMKKQVAILQSIAIAAIAFATVGLSLALFSTCRTIVHASIWRGQSGNPAVHPNSSLMVGSTSVRRQKSSGNLSDSSFNGA